MDDADAEAAARVRGEVKVERTRTATHRIVRFQVGRLHGRDAAGHLWRLDKYLHAILPRIPRSVIRRWLAAGCARLDGAPAGERAKLRAGQQVELVAPLPGAGEADDDAAEPSLRILHRGRGWLALDKPPGQLAHEAGREMTGTLLNHAQGWARANGIDPAEVRLVNRIDRDTSGIVIATTDLATHLRLAAAMESRDLRKEYRAIASGAPQPESGDWRDPIGDGPPGSVARQVRADGQHAWTGYRTLAVAAGCALLAIDLHTGRQHQIRVHAAHAGHPLVGDWVYGAPCAELPGQALHSAVLELDDPEDGRRRRIEAPLPEAFAALWRQLEAGRPPTPRALDAEERRKLGLPPERPAIRLPEWLSPEEFARLDREQGR